MVIYNSFCYSSNWLFAIAANTVRLLLCSEWSLDTVVGVRTLFSFMWGRYSYPPPELHGPETSVRWIGLCRIEDRYADMWNQPLPRYLSKLFRINVSKNKHHLSRIVRKRYFWPVFDHTVLACFRSIDSTIPLLLKYENSSLAPSYAQPCLCQT